MKKLLTAIGILISLSTLAGILYGLDNRWAKNCDLTAVSQRLEEKIRNDRADRIQERVWKLEDRYQNKPMEESVKEEYRQLKKELDNIKKGDKR